MQKSSPLAAAISNAILSIQRKAVVMYVKGVPGGGKNFVMSYLALAFLMEPTVQMLWAAAGNGAINEGASLMQAHINQLLPTAP